MTSAKKPKPTVKSASKQRTPKKTGARKKNNSLISKRREIALEKSGVAYQERRQEIGHAASKVFFEKGLQVASIGDIAKELGIDRATLYYYFVDKQDIFDEVVREVAELDVAFAESTFAGNEPPLEKLNAVINDLMKSYATHYPLLYVYIRENLSVVKGTRSEWSSYMRNLNRRYDLAITAIVQEGIDDGSIRPLASARTMAFGIIGTVGWTNRWYSPDRSSESAEVIGTAFAAMLLHGLAN